MSSNDIHVRRGHTRYDREKRIQRYRMRPTKAASGPPLPPEVAPLVGEDGHFCSHNIHRMRLRP